MGYLQSGAALRDRMRQRGGFVWGGRLILPGLELLIIQEYQTDIASGKDDCKESLMDLLGIRNYFRLWVFFMDA